MNNLFNLSRILHTIIIFYGLLFLGVYILYSTYSAILFFRINLEHFYAEDLTPFDDTLKISQDSSFWGYGLFAVVLHIGLSIWLKPHQWKLKDCYKIYWFILLQIGLCALPFILILL